MGGQDLWQSKKVNGKWTTAKASEARNAGVIKLEQAVINLGREGLAEMIYAMICFEQGEFAEAMDFFADADENSDGACWESEDPKYEAFYNTLC